MSIPQQRAAGPNQHGIFPPKGCSIFGADATALQVATPLTKGAFEQSLLVNKGKGSLDSIVTQLVQQSATLKAWFAPRLKSSTHQRGQGISCARWDSVWALIQESKATWIAQYHGSENRAVQWEMGRPLSLAELQARVFLVLYQKIQENREGDLESTLGFKWHPYYYEEVGIYFLLHQFLIFLRKQTGDNYTMSIFRPLGRSAQDDQRREAWEQTPGFQVCKMSEQFMAYRNWDPTTLIKSADVDTDEQEIRAEETDTVSFMLAGDEHGQIFTLKAGDIPQVEEGGQGMCECLQRRLQWPKCFVDIVGVSLDYGEADDDASVDTLVELRRFMGWFQEPIFRLHTADTGHKAEPKHIAHQNYAEHCILKLDSLTNKLDPSHAIEARPRFDLIRLNHRRSAEFIEELWQLFLPLEQKTSEHWQELSVLKDLCEMARADTARAFDLEAHFGILSDQQQAHARQNLELIRSNHPLASHAQALLVDMFTPQINDSTEVSRTKKIFDEVREAASLD